MTNPPFSEHHRFYGGDLLQTELLLADLIWPEGRMEESCIYLGHHFVHAMCMHQYMLLPSSFAEHLVLFRGRPCDTSSYDFSTPTCMLTLSPACYQAGFARWRCFLSF